MVFIMNTRVRLSVLGCIVLLSAGTVSARRNSNKIWGLSSSSRQSCQILQQNPVFTISRGGGSVMDVSNHNNRLMSALTEHIYEDARDGPLLDDIEVLNKILSKIVEKESPQLKTLYEHYRNWGRGRAHDLQIDDVDAGAGPDLKAMIQQASELSARECLGVARIFTIMLNLVNAAEVQHKQRQLTQAHKSSDTESILVSPLPDVEVSIRGTVDALLKEGRDKEAVYNQICQQYVEIVLTAHPTQVQRKSLLRKYRQVSELLGRLDHNKDNNENDNGNSAIDAFDRAETLEKLETTIVSIWGADEIRRIKPTVNQEAAGGLAILESVLWDAVPMYLRKLDWVCRNMLDQPQGLPMDVTPVKFASWIGGDRDGNPNVTPEVTLQVNLDQRMRAARLLTNNMYQLLSELAISSKFSPELEELAAKTPSTRHVREKYRRVVGHLIRRLQRTLYDCESELARAKPNFNAASSFHEDLEAVEPISSADDLIEPLMVMYRSLESTGFGLIANGLLQDVIRRVHVFGLSLVPLDIREESTKHTLALDGITNHLGLGSYKDWSEEERLKWLSGELSSKRPLFRVRDVLSLGLDESVVKTLNVFETISELQPSSLGAYVISQAQTASDVLAVMLLQKQYGMTPTNGNMMRVAPLFETLNDLDNAPATLERLFSIDNYVNLVNSKQEVMVGYSDSAKDAGRLAACWAQYESQEKMVGVAAKHQVELTFFHGKGGTVGRGGNPSVYRAIMSHPPNTINGRFRVTEQGEMIQQNFGAPSVAERTLDIYTAALCREAFYEHVNPSPEWRAQMKRISKISCDDYRHLVREEPRFVPYFRQATPELELGSLNIGSRPSKRNPKGGIESLRAIPWTFAWAQTRAHLSSWLGVGAGLSDTKKKNDMLVLRDMYKNWLWFHEIIDLIAMIMSKTDWSISKNYDDQLVDKTEGLTKLGDEVRRKMVETRQSILDVTESLDVAGAHAALMRASATIRHPYVDPVNVVQAELLKRLRAMEQKPELSKEEEEEREILKDALVISIKGIAQGMRNSG